MKSLKRSSLFKAAIVSFVMLAYQNCSQVSFEAAEFASKAAKTEVADTPANCSAFEAVSASMKVIFVVDNTAAADKLDPDKAYRRSALLNLVTNSSAKTNFSWTLIAFDDAGAEALINSGQASAPAFGNVDGIKSAIAKLETVSSHGEKASYKPVLQLVEATIKNDPDFLAAPTLSNYLVLFVAAAPVADFGDPLDAKAAQAAFDAELALSPDHISLNAIYFGESSSAASGSSTAHLLKSMADRAGGLFTQAEAPLSAALDADLYQLGSFTLLPNAICVDPDVLVSLPGPMCPSELRVLYGAESTHSESCGLDGKKDVTTADRITESCKVVSGALVWTEVSRTSVTRGETSCSGQSCRLADGSLLGDGLSRPFYSNARPTGACSSVSETRTCRNGALTGSSTFSQLSCRSGCGTFGADGTVKTGVVVDQLSVPVNCRFGETGITSRYEQLADQTCSDGRIVQSNLRQGRLLEAGVCPSYQWVGTDSWSACSANCGGQQTREFACRDSKGRAADPNRCSGARPVETRVCDGNPNAVRRVETSTTQEQSGNTTLTCPKNQIGVVVESRDVTTTKTFACVNHQVALADTKVERGAWVRESYCRDYVAHRCSQDSLNNTEADGRYQWMLKCRAQVPAINEFLSEFADVKVGVGQQLIITLNSNGRHLYPTFMNTATKPEKPWIAPKSANASCAVPATAYVAAVCVSSCATPEQEIMVAAEAKLQMRSMPFVDALLKQAQFVGTLAPNSTIASRELMKTKVDQWVTELVDTEHDIVQFRMKSGKTLRLTPNHPVLTAEGAMKAAGDFRVGESLVQLGGELDPIVAIDRVKYFGKVYNVFVQSAELKKNIVVTGGYLNGTAFFQNEGASNLNRQLFNKNLIRGVFEK